MGLAGEALFLPRIVLSETCSVNIAPGDVLSQLGTPFQGLCDRRLIRVLDFTAHGNTTGYPTDSNIERLDESSQIHRCGLSFHAGCSCDDDLGYLFCLFGPGAGYCLVGPADNLIIRGSTARLDSGRQPSQQLVDPQIFWADAIKRRQ